MSAFASLNRLAKWRSVFAGWQLGTRRADDPECQAVRDHREVTIILRAEVNALTSLLAEKGIVKPDEWERVLEREAEQLSADYARRFRGMTATDEGIAYDVAVLQEHETMKGWLP